MTKQSNTPLIMATKKGMTDIVQLLLDRGADVNRKDKVSTIPLFDNICLHLLPNYSDIFSTI